MNVQELKKISEENLDFIKSSYLSEGLFIPMIIAHVVKAGKKERISIMFSDKDIKNRFDVLANWGIELGVRTFLKNEYDSVDGIFLSNEAWMSKYDKDQLEEKEKTGGLLMPSEDPKHLEVLISAGSSGQDTVVAMKIIRKIWDNGKIKVEFEEIKDVDSKEKDGGEEGIEVKSNLLDEFWRTFNFIKKYKEEVDKDENLKEIIKKKSSEDLVRLYSEVFHAVRDLEILTNN